jgi:hypothetical protein
MIVPYLAKVRSNSQTYWVINDYISWTRVSTRVFKNRNINYRHNSWSGQIGSFLGAYRTLHQHRPCGTRLAVKMISRISLFTIILRLLAFNAKAEPGTGDVVCRFESTTRADVNYYTCTELALKYSITIEKFFLLNPLLDENCATIQPNTTYCVAGCRCIGIKCTKKSSILTSRQSYNHPQRRMASVDHKTTMLRVSASTSNVAMERLGNAAINCQLRKDLHANLLTRPREDCQAGTCFSGACEGFPSEYSMDGKCGYEHNDLQCGGKWGNCCNIEGSCGTGESHCGVGRCQTGNCTIIIPPAPGLPPSITTPPASVPTQGAISPDGSCGGTNKYLCKGSSFGECCSASGFCGSTTSHCQAGCQTAFGNCTDPSLSPDGTCGGTNKYQCKGTSFGDCCSSSGFCGSTTGHCQAGCQTAFGTCTSTDLSPDGTCGGSQKYKCGGSSYGDCCSSSGYCGKSGDHCGNGCQASFGLCSSVTTSQAPAQTGISTDGTCGGGNGLKCQGSAFGNCCSSGGYCGSSVNHCAQGWSVLRLRSCAEQHHANAAPVKSPFLADVSHPISPV